MTIGYHANMHSIGKLLHENAVKTKSHVLWKISWNVYLRFLIFLADLGVRGVDGVCSLSPSLETEPSTPVLGGGTRPFVDLAEAGVGGVDGVGSTGVEGGNALKLLDANLRYFCSFSALMAGICSSEVRILSLRYISVAV